MARSFVLDKILVEGTEYQTDRRLAYIVKKIGTDSTSNVYIEIDGKTTGEINSYVAPIHRTSSNLLGPLDLGDLYYVIPPDTKFEVQGASGAKIRVIGSIILLEPGEDLREPYTGRYNEQFNHYLEAFSGSFSLTPADTAWGADTEYEIYSLTPKTIETYRFARYIGVSITNGTVSEGDFGITFYLDNNPLENIIGTNVKKGVDALSLPLPPADTTEEIPFTLHDFPIEVKGDHTLSIRCVNVSGAAKSPDSGKSWTVTVRGIYEYIRKR